MTLVHKDLPVYSFVTATEFYDWLSKNHDQLPAFWLRYYKKASGKPTIIHDEAVDAALCWGWIDGLANRYDEESYLIRFTPRRAKSVWSKINVEKVARLIDSGKMQPCGLEHVTRAQADGRWDAAYAGQATITIPEEFETLVKTDRKAWEFYGSLNKTNRYAIAYRLATATNDKTRQQRMEKLFEKLKKQQLFHEPTANNRNSAD